MPASSVCLLKANRLGVGIQQVRFLKRRLAYPQAYRAKVAPLTHPKKDHASNFQRQLKEWLGPKNLRGEYYRNKYYYPPQDHKPKYIVPDGNTIVDGNASETQNDRRPRGDRNASVQPFPFNPYCKTSSIVSNELKQQIFEEVSQGAHVQEIAYKYGIKIPRVEAIVKLQAIENEWKESEKIPQDLEKFANTMYKMFPLYQPPVGAENLTEIPTPQRTLHQRFLTIAESEPFGPVDAAKLFGLEPAQQVLNTLTEIKSSQEESKQHSHKVLLGSVKQGDRTTFKFTKAKSGDVGFRYGASRRDRKKDRAIGFDRSGAMVYI